jgi:DNA-binding CsgD family transcriptional regulator
LAPRKDFESEVKRLRLAGKPNKEIAQIFGTQDHIVEHAARNFIKRKEIESRS